MNASELVNLIDRDLKANARALNWHGHPITKCLVVPEQRQFADSHNDNKPVSLWLVFEEDPVNRSAYKVVYSEQDQEFGLAVSGTERDVFIGFYGGFVETLCSM